MITNWAGNVTFGVGRVDSPGSVAELQRLMATADRVRVIGTGHSFSPIADTTGSLVSLAGLPQSAEVDRDARSVRVDGGMTYAGLARELAGSGLALSNTASLPHISLAGACATGTHGSGVTNQVLAAAVRSVTIVTATGDLVTLERGSPDFPGSVLALGRLGAVVEMVLDLVPDFLVAQTVVDDPDEAVVAAGLESILGAAYSVSVCTDWARKPRLQLWLKEHAGRPDGWVGEPRWGGRLADGPRHMLEGMPTAFATQQLAVPGPWADRLPHFRADFMPSSGAELQSEYLLPMSQATAAWNALSEARDVIVSALQGCEIRCVAGDDLWLSPTAGSLCVAYHFTWVPDPEKVRPAVRLVEDRLTGLGARPHWAKVFTMSPEQLAPLYPKLAEFQRLVVEHDPAGKFRNHAVDAWLGL